MGSMIRSRKKWVCSGCQSEYIKWEGKCRTCGEVNTLAEVTLLPPRAKATPLQRQRAPADPNKRLRRRAKDSERSIAKRMIGADGPDPAFARIASSTGRTGHITNMRVDAVSRSYVTENKNRKMPSWLIDAWVLINQRGKDFGKHVLLHVDPPNMPREIQINTVKEKLDTLAIITQGRHEELILGERVLADLLEEFGKSGQYKGLITLYLVLQERYSKK